MAVVVVVVVAVVGSHPVVDAGLAHRRWRRERKGSEQGRWLTVRSCWLGKEAAGMFVPSLTWKEGTGRAGRQGRTNGVRHAGDISRVGPVHLFSKLASQRDRKRKGEKPLFFLVKGLLTNKREHG